MGLTQKILLFVSVLVIALVAASLAFTTVQADRLAQENVARGLEETRQVWETFQADRYNKLKMGIRVLGNDPYFKPLVETGDAETILDTLKERNEETKADFILVTNPSGVVITRTDRPTATGEDLSKVPVVMKPLEGEESSTVWRQGDRLFHAVSVPMITGPELKGVLVAGYALNEALASDIRKLTHSEIAFLTQNPAGKAEASVSTLGPREAALKSALPSWPAGVRTDQFSLDLGGAPFAAVQMPLQAATGEAVGSVLALRSLDDEMAAFRRFRTSLVVVSLVVMALGLTVAYFVASRVTGPVRRLVELVDGARSGRYAGKVDVGTSDEIGTLAKAFNSLLADLREKEQMIDFLREGMTMMKKGAAGVTQPASATLAGQQETAAVSVSSVTGIDVHKGDLFASRYDILSTLGKGGMGVVYRAHDRQLDEEVALKVLRPDVMKTDPTLLERFKQEIKLARRITHRNVLRTHDFGETGATPYISMEYLEGVTLKDLVTSKGALPIGVGLRIAKQMCLGLEAAHEQGVVHRDIKPQNMLILPETGELKIMDFGIARVSEVKPGTAGSGLTTAGMVMGTPDYMSPEQAQGAPADFRSDIYSLGVVLFEVFVGRLPFTGDNMMAVVMSHIQKAPPSPRSMNPRVPPRLEAVILHSLEKDPARRYQSVSEVLEGLDAVSAEAPSGTGPSATAA
jgi:HAMP domain-containing protein/predicted Ser/Thr protein kinase